jgi:hypothetical protein
MSILATEPIESNTLLIRRDVTQTIVPEPGTCDLLSFFLDHFGSPAKEDTDTMEIRDMYSDWGFTMEGNCPYSGCRVFALFRAVTNFHVAYYGNTGVNGQHKHKSCAVFSCPRCKKFILGVVRWDSLLSTQAGAILQYEASYPVDCDDFVDEHISDKVAKDFREALRCCSVQAYNATAEMCRLALERCCIEKGAQRDVQLDKQIDYLAAPEQDVLGGRLRKLAHKIRLGGARAAHPEEDREVTEAEADALIEFSKQFFSEIYVLPSKLEEHDFTKKAWRGDK